VDESWAALLGGDWVSVKRLVLAALLGGVIGAERESLRKPAGMRTHMLVALGSALTTTTALELDMVVADLSRVVQGVVTGIGFVGAGAILKDDGRRRVHGLTTAAGLWLTAAVGVAVGAGRSFVAVASVGLTLLVLLVLGRLEKAVPKREGEGAGEEEGGSS
jgi:putative Mg2+ transporter-C (MgtC) family protein